MLARDRVRTLLQLKARGWCKELPPRGRSGAPLISRIPTERGVLDLFPPVPDGAEPVAHRENAVGRPLCLLVRMRRPHQASCQIAGGMRREGEPKGSHLARITAVRYQVAVVETDNMADLAVAGRDDDGETCALPVFGR